MTQCELEARVQAIMYTRYLRDVKIDATLADVRKMAAWAVQDILDEFWIIPRRDT